MSESMWSLSIGFFEGTSTQEIEEVHNTIVSFSAFYDNKMGLYAIKNIVECMKIFSALQSCSAKRQINRCMVIRITEVNDVLPALHSQDSPKPTKPTLKVVR